ncbi:MAG TPA: ECF transporter S component [Thermotogota bacterium]|nr:ECF transporter S component [Thermotogota bacterium]HPJ89358.1 ECF transporter S component [Thermotogota bacterium]HPR96518.1 ECF transporter S component [Thermotogota bacterium]
MNTRKMVFAAMFVALGIVIPRVFHMIGGAALGSVLLPMHLPVLIGAMLIGPFYGLIIGIGSVLVGFLLGMPAMPMAAFMFFELATYGLVAGYFGFNRKMNVYLSLILAMLIGRVVSLSAMLIAIHLLGISLPPVFGTIAMFSTGIPGMILQVVIVPPLVILLRRLFDFEQSDQPVKSS